MKTQLYRSMSLKTVSKTRFSSKKYSRSVAVSFRETLKHLKMYSEKPMTCSRKFHFCTSTIHLGCKNVTLKNHVLILWLVERTVTNFLQRLPFRRENPQSVTCNGYCLGLLERRQKTSPVERAQKNNEKSIKFFKYQHF